MACLKQGLVLTRPLNSSTCRKTKHSYKHDRTSTNCNIIMFRSALIHTYQFSTLNIESMINNQRRNEALYWPGSLSGIGEVMTTFSIPSPPESLPRLARSFIYLHIGVELFVPQMTEDIVTQLVHCGSQYITRLS